MKTRLSDCPSHLTEFEMASVKPCLWAQHRFLFLPPVCICSSVDVNQLRLLLCGKVPKLLPTRKACPARNRVRSRNIDLSKIAVIINAKLVIKDLSKCCVLRQGDVWKDSSPHVHGGVPAGLLGHCSPKSPIYSPTLSWSQFCLLLLWPNQKALSQLYPSYCYKAYSCFYFKLNLFPFVAQVFPSFKQLFHSCLLVFTPTHPQVFMENNPIPFQPSAKHIRCCLFLSGSAQHWTASARQPLGSGGNVP